MAVEPVKDTISRAIDNVIYRRIDITTYNSVHDAVRVPVDNAVYVTASFEVSFAIYGAQDAFLFGGPVWP